VKANTCPQRILCNRNIVKVWKDVMFSIEHVLNIGKFMVEQRRAAPSPTEKFVFEGSGIDSNE